VLAAELDDVDVDQPDVVLEARDRLPAGLPEPLEVVEGLEAGQGPGERGVGAGVLGLELLEEGREQVLLRLVMVVEVAERSRASRCRGSPCG